MASVLNGLSVVVDKPGYSYRQALFDTREGFKYAGQKISFVITGSKRRIIGDRRLIVAERKRRRAV